MARRVSHTGIGSAFIPKKRCLPRVQSGFTIVELLVVIVVIAILAAIVIVAYNGVTKQAYTSALKSDLRTAATQLGIENTTDGSYPGSESAANDGKGLVKSEKTAYQYTYNATDNSYCLTATSETNGVPAYHISSTNGSIEEGACPGHSSGGVIEVATLAGDGATGFANGTGAAAKFYYPSSIAVDASGTLYVADYGNNRIRKVTPGGVVTTLAGSGAYGFANGSSTTAQFAFPQGIAVDAAGTVYVADTYNHRIRKIASDGTVTTLAGSGTAGYLNGTGTAAQFNYPYGVAVDAAGTVYVTDGDNNRIRKISSAGEVTLLAGSGTAGTTNGIGAAAQFNGPRGIAIDSSGTLYVAEYYSHRIRKVAQDGTVSSFVGSTQGYADGTGSAAKFSNPYGITIDSSGALYVADESNNRIRKITPSGEVTTFVGSTQGVADGTSETAQFYYPRDIAIDASGTFYVADKNNNKIRKITQ